MRFPFLRYGVRSGLARVLRTLTAALAVASFASPAATITSSVPPGVPAAGVPAAGAPAATADVAGAVHVVTLPDGRLIASDFAPIIQRGELVVAMLGIDSPPFFSEKNGQLAGIEVDLANDIGRALGVKVRFDRSAMTFDGVVKLLASGHADIAISKLSQTLARARQINYSRPYLTLHRALLINRMRFAVHAGKRTLPDVIRTFDGAIGVIASSSYADYAKKNFPRAKIVPYPSWQALIDGLKAGDVIAAYRDEFEIKRLLKLDPTASLTLRTVTFQDLNDTLAVGVRVDEPTVLSFINEYLTERNEKLDITSVLDAAKQ